MSIEQSIIKGMRILIVDDEPVNVILLESILEENGYTQVVSTTDSRTVAGLVTEHSPDLILLDYRMPFMDGLQVMQALAQIIDPDDFLPIIVLTAQTDDQTRQRALEAGAKDFVNKPFLQWEILNRIHNTLETRHYFKRQKVRADELEDLVRARTKELRETQFNIIQSLGRAGEYRDNETGAHVVRMSMACELVAIEAGLGEKHAELLRLASPMHDVGKIGIPDKILLKPARLTKEERAIMMTHAKIGAEIIGEHPSKLLSLARSIALYHHEKWDGTGYPHGLKGEEIPLPARIAAICDVFDALISERPYKKAWTVEDALALIDEEAGKHFDPKLVGCFKNILDKVIAIREQFPDAH